MLRSLLLSGISIYIASETWKLLRQTSRRFTEKRSKSYRKTEGEDRISALPDDLVVHILMFVRTTKDVVATMILSKRWRSVWKMVPQLLFRDIDYVTRKRRRRFVGGLFGKSSDHDERRCINWQFLHKSLQLHKAPVLQNLVIQLGSRSPIDVNVGKCIAIAVKRRVRVLWLELTWSAKPIRLPKSLYTCDTLFSLSLSCKIVLDVPSSSACLPSLQDLTLNYIVYKNEDSQTRLLSSCPILKYLVVRRHHKDNVTRFNIKVSSLENLVYDYSEVGVQNGSLVIDSPALKRIFINDFSGGSFSIENKPRFAEVSISLFRYPDEKFMRSLSSVMYLELCLGIPTVVCCNTINFSQLTDCKIFVQNELDWLEPLMLLLHNSPTLKFLFIEQSIYEFGEDFPLSWNQPSSVPRCLSTNLEVFEWKHYGGRIEEKQIVRYIFNNSKSLKRAGIAMKPTCNWRDKRKMRKELEYMPRASTSSQLLFFTQLDNWKLWEFKF